MKIEDFYFPVEEKHIALIDNTPWLNQIKGYKAIIAPDKSNQVISVAKNSYKLVRNKELIEPFLEQVCGLGVRWKVDPSHSFCEPNRMRLQITFPDILIKDEESDIPLSVYLHNSYDMSEGVRLFWGAIRTICSNGMVLGSILGSLYARHTQGFSFENFYEEFGNASDKIQSVQKHIQVLQERAVNEELMDNLHQALGKRRVEQIVNTDKVPDISQWDLLNDVTYYISHNEEKPNRAHLQLKTSKVFQL